MPDAARTLEHGPESARLGARFKKMQADGLVDVKFAFDEDLTGATVESICGEVNAMLDAFERGEGTRLVFNDSRRPLLDAQPPRDP